MNQNNACSSNVGNYYFLHPGLTGTTALAGEQNFTVKELEVYQINY